ncbi:MAG: lysylphosphatidylglycerol synthase domain-containing protein [Candidatus Peribacteraceae bacterium]|nr:lysylphosphatidylglycerol synthase domain-containing protein [Candidatus Peribacteraceae bacterium]
MDRRKILHPLGFVLGIIVFAIALWAIHRSLGRHHYSDIIRSIKDLPNYRIWMALGLTLFNYILLAGFDILAARYAGRSIPYKKIAIPSFIGYAFHYNAGAFGGGAVRYRLYSTLGFSTKEIGKVILLFLLTFSLGFLTLTGIALLWEPLVMPGTTVFPEWPDVVGVLFLVISAGYLILAWRGKGVRLFGRNIALPSFPMSLLQLSLAITDWIIASSILFVLLPHEVRASFPVFVVIFMLAHVAGIISHSPGGFGIFEATIVHLLPTAAPTTEVLGVLLAYRGIYYLFPLLIASTLLGWQEYNLKKHHVHRSVRAAKSWCEAIRVACSRGKAEPQKQ